MVSTHVFIPCHALITVLPFAGLFFIQQTFIALFYSPFTNCTLFSPSHRSMNTDYMQVSRVVVSTWIDPIFLVLIARWSFCTHLMGQWTAVAILEIIHVNIATDKHRRKLWSEFMIHFCVRIPRIRIQPKRNRFLPWPEVLRTDMGSYPNNLFLLLFVDVCFLGLLEGAARAQSFHRKVKITLFYYTAPFPLEGIVSYLKCCLMDERRQPSWKEMFCWSLGGK